MKFFHFYPIIMCVLFSVVSSCNSSGDNQLEDDRIVRYPLCEKTLDEMIAICKKRSDLQRNPYLDTTSYFATFNFLSRNDTVKVQVMGMYENAFIFHDSIGRNNDKFLGFFKIRKNYCFFYHDLFNGDTLSNGKNQTYIMNKFLQGWRLRSSWENPDLFVKDITTLSQDPYLFEFSIDSIGNYKLLRKGHW